VVAVYAMVVMLLLSLFRKIIRGGYICNGCGVAVEPVQEDCPWCGCTCNGRDVAVEPVQC
jgi:rubrerythrin